jgi:hypothetical protein
LTFSFKRNWVPAAYYADIDLKIDDAIKFDLFDDTKIIGTLITSESESFAKFRDGISYKQHDRSLFKPGYEHIIFNEKDVPFARITVGYHVFKETKVTLVFFGHPHSYILKSSNFHNRKDSFDLIIDITLDNQSVFKLKNSIRGKLFSDFDRSRPMEGTIEFTDALHRDMIFGFLFAIQLFYRGDDKD